MSNAKFTPGPWSVGNTTVRKYGSMSFPEVAVHVGTFEKHGNCLAIVHLGGSGAISSLIADVEANARLISAAPEMYEALKLILTTHCCDTGEADYSAKWDGDHTICPYCKPSYAALAKAVRP
jgi:hypothetical protein